MLIQDWSDKSVPINWNPLFQIHQIHFNPCLTTIFNSKTNTECYSSNVKKAQCSVRIFIAVICHFSVIFHSINFQQIYSSIRCEQCSDIVVVQTWSKSRGLTAWRSVNTNRIRYEGKLTIYSINRGFTSDNSGLKIHFRFPETYFSNIFEK